MGYYQVLQRQDQLRNEKENIKRLEQTVMLTRVLVEGGRVSRIELDQSNQNLFNAQIRYESDLQSYRNSLDTFKITIGLPVLANVELDYPADLELLAKDGLKDLGFDEEKAISTALAVRPDVLTHRADLRDAQRNVEIATNAFLPQLDVTAGIEVPMPDSETSTICVSTGTRDSPTSCSIIPSTRPTTATPIVTAC